jgi:hypothetical protein
LTKIGLKLEDPVLEHDYVNGNVVAPLVSDAGSVAAIEVGVSVRRFIQPHSGLGRACAVTRHFMPGY